MRKRKCDGQKPYCGNCTKNSARDENGNPVCTYSQVQKKRGPKKGYKGMIELTRNIIATIRISGSYIESAAKNREARPDLSMGKEAPRIGMES
jgi:hypothetical protein